MLKIVYRRFVLIVLFLTTANAVIAQDAKTDFQKVNAAYSKANSLGMQVHYNLFSNYTTQTAFESSEGTYLKQGNNYSSTLLGITTVQNKKYRISIDSGSKTIILSNPVETKRDPSPVQLDSLLKHCSKVEFKKNENGERQYRLHLEKVPFFEFDLIEIRIDSNFFVSKLILFYRNAVTLDETNSTLNKEKPRLEIAYSAVTTNPVIEKEQFSEMRFISVNGKMITAQSAYRGYKVLNHKQ